LFTTLLLLRTSTETRLVFVFEILFAEPTPFPITLFLVEREESPAPNDTEFVLYTLEKYVCTFTAPVIMVVLPLFALALLSPVFIDPLIVLVIVALFVNVTAVCF
jgi:hypothetical protein